MSRTFPLSALMLSLLSMAACRASSRAMTAIALRSAGSAAPAAWNLATAAPHVSRTHPSSAFSIASSASGPTPLAAR